MIKCTECGKEISDKAEKCPNCGCPIQNEIQSVQNNQPEKKKNSGLSIVAAILALFTCTAPIGIILAVVDLITAKKGEKKHGCSWFAIIFGTLAFIVLVSNLGKSSDNKNVSEIMDTSPTEEVANESEYSESSESKDDGKNISEGESFENNGLKVTINDVDADFTDYEDEYGLYKLDEGKKYIKISFTYENSGDSDKYVSIYDYDCYADGTLCEQSYNFGGDFINANISPSRNVSFDTYYVVPKDAESIELEYTANIWTGEKVIIKIQ